MKKILAVVLCITFLFSTVACGSEKPNDMEYCQSVRDSCMALLHLFPLLLEAYRHICAIDKRRRLDICSCGNPCAVLDNYRGHLYRQCCDHQTADTFEAGAALPCRAAAGEDPSTDILRPSAGRSGTVSHFTRGNRRPRQSRPCG